MRRKHQIDVEASMSPFFLEILQNGWRLKNVGERHDSLRKKEHLKTSIRMGDSGNEGEGRH